MKTKIKLLIFLSFVFAGTLTASQKKWGAEVNVLWPIFPGNMYTGVVTYEAWRVDDWAGVPFLGVLYHPEHFREDEGNFSNLAATFGYRQFFWRGAHIELYSALGQGKLNNSVINGKNYKSTDFEVGLLAGYEWVFGSSEDTIQPYISMHHGVYYVAAKSNAHPIRNSSGEVPVYVGRINIGFKF
ncbi:MAG: hypothetical protein KDK38_07120 [Leptospiraceae bacterium]|nr:hypothetical protein [Leptospiraceae bacterium]